MNPTQSRLFRQNTIARPTAIEGLGIHTGKLVSLRLVPAPENTGVLFRRTDVGIDIPATDRAVCSLELATTIGRDDVTVSTVEHLLAAIHAAPIDNIVIEVDGPEVPILDGSALPYCRLLEAAGTRQQRALRRILAVTEPVSVQLSDGRSARVSPYPGLRISYRIDYEHPTIGTQSCDVAVANGNFVKELAPARTFALLGDVERLQRSGLGLGGREDNCLVFGKDGPVHGSLRFADEPVRHKALDAVGDLALLGCPLWGHVEVERGGHLVHFRLIEELRRQSSSWTWLHGEASSHFEPDHLRIDPAQQHLVS